MIIRNKDKISSPDTIKEHFEALGYICSDAIATSVYLACHLQKPILVEGPPGVGKTELAKKTSELLAAPLIRMQCYEGLDEAKALYEWKYGKQLLYTQLLKDQLGDVMRGAKGLDESVTRLHQFGDIFYSDEFLEPRPLLEALRAEDGAILLIDEIDKADIEFPNDLLLELDRMEFYVYELQRTIVAKNRPIVIITSNNEKELPDAFLRRCLFHYIRFPDSETMKEIVDVHFPKIADDLVQQALRLFYSVREVTGLKKKPSTSELIDWLKLLLLEKMQANDLQNMDLSQELPPHLHALIKNEQDLESIREWQRFRK